MKKTLFLTLGISTLLFLGSCKSGVTLEDVRSQESEAEKALTKAHSELVELAKLKEQHVVDNKEARKSALKDKINQIDKDIKKLSGVSSGGAEAGADQVVKNLEKKKKEIEGQIKEVEKIKEEDWDESVERINQRITDLQREIDLITESLPTEETEGS